MQVLVILALIISIGAAVFAVQNPTTVSLRFIGWNFQGSLALMLLLSFGLGFLSSFLLSLASLVRRRWVIRSQQRRIAELEAQHPLDVSAAPQPSLPR